MNKKQFGLLAGIVTALMLIGAGCSSSTPNNLNDQGKGEEKNTATEQNQNIGTSAIIAKPPVNKAVVPTPAPAPVSTPTKETVTVKEFTITAKDWQFSPNNMTVKKGDKVRLTITSTDVTHSFMLKDYNLNVILEPGQTQTVEFVADKAGTFGFRCGVPCGEGHREMTGTLTVE